MLRGRERVVKRNKMNAQMLKYKHEKSGPFNTIQASILILLTFGGFIDGTTIYICALRNAHAQYEHARLNGRKSCSAVNSGQVTDLNKFGW